jgi:hypothetical protein
MRLRNFVRFCAVIFVALPALSAFQSDQAAGNPTTIEKKAKAKAKKAEHAGEAAAESAAGTTATTSEKPAATPKTRKARTEATGAAQRAMPTVPESEIAAAKASGKVWVNTDTGVYHKGGQWYGATKQGKFMTEQEAIKSGYRASKSK